MVKQTMNDAAPYRFHFWREALAIVGILGLTVIFFWKILLTNLILVGLDVFTYFYPYREYAAEAWRQGRISLWNPYLFMGAPFLANVQAAVFYPLNVILAWFPTPQLINVSIVSHIFLAGVFTYFFARCSLKLGLFSSFLAACCFALSGFLSAQVEHINQLNVTAWLPLLLLLMDRVWDTPRLYPADDSQAVERVSTSPSPLLHVRKGEVPTTRLFAGLVAGFVVALQILAGHTQATYITLFGVGFYALLPLLVAHIHFGVSWRVSAAHAAQRILWLVGSAVVGGLLSAVQLLPTLELSGLSYRSGGLPYREAVSFSLRPQLLLQSLLPPYHLDLSQIFGASFSEYVIYVGITGLILAAVGWLWGRNPHRHVFGVLALIGLFLGFGAYNPAYYLLYRLFPGFAMFRAPVRWMALYSFAVSLLVGYGVQSLFSPDFTQRVRATGSNLVHLLRSNRFVRIAVMVLIPISAFTIYFLDFPETMTVLIWATCFAIGLAAVGLIALQRLPMWLGQSILVIILIGELFVASRGLAYNNPTAPQAYDFLRPAPTFLLTDPGEHRFISMSGITYDPGDLKEIEDIYGWQLPQRAVYDYVVCVKQKEVLAFNLPLHFRLYVVDGYDGGLLPLKRFVELQELFLPEDQVSPDGRLREQLKEVPESRLLSLLNVKYVITDKVYDVWIDDVFYDLQFTARLGPGLAQTVGTQDILPDAATAIGVISFLRGTADLPDDTPAAEVVVTDTEGVESHHLLRAGRETAEGEYGHAGTVKHAKARTGHSWRDNPDGNDYVAVFEFEQPRVIKDITIYNRLAQGEFHLRGVSLIDQRSVSNRTVLLSTSGHFRLVYSGDVKIYENLDNLPRAFIVHQAQVLAEDTEIVAAMRDPSFDPTSTVILAQPAGLQDEITTAGKSPAAQQVSVGNNSVKIVSYAPEQVVLDADASAPGYLVLADTYYPGWEASVDGQSVPIYRANLIARAIELPAGRHRIEFNYRPRPFYIGAAISLVSLLAVVIGLLWSVLCAGLKIACCCHSEERSHKDSLAIGK